MYDQPWVEWAHEADQSDATSSSILDNELFVIDKYLLKVHRVWMETTNALVL